MIAALLAAPRQAKLAVAIYAALLLAALGWGITLGIANSQLDSEIDAKTQVLAGLKRHALPDSAGVARVATQFAAVAAPTETVAASVLQKRLLDVLAQAGGSVHTIQAEVTRETISDGLRRLNAQVTFESSNATLQQLLYALETDVPFVFIESLLARPAAATVPGITAGDSLAVTLAVWSYWKSGETGAPGPSTQ
jgi:hypothetical protein